MHHRQSLLHVVALTAILGSTVAGYAEPAPQKSANATKKPPQSSVYVQQRQTKETIELDQLAPMAGCKQVGVEVTSQGMVKKCFDNLPLWKD